MRGYIYAIGNEETDQDGNRKLGITLYPVHRQRQYTTGDCPGREKQYQLLAVVEGESKKSLYTELFLIEHRMQEHFKKNRLTRKNGIRSEWFHIEVHEVQEFLRATGRVRNFLTAEEIAEVNDEVLRAPYEKTDEIEEEDTHLKKLNQNPRTLFQLPHLHTLLGFLEDKEKLAAFFVAPCGYGKTRVTCKAIKTSGKDRVILCVPTDSLKQSWKKTLMLKGGFKDSEIVDSTESLQETLNQKRFVLLLCYASTHLLLPLVSKSCVDLIVFDEAHRLAGIAEVSKDLEEEQGTDTGRTKRLVRACAEQGIKRLSLSFTPKSYWQEYDVGHLVNNNSDVTLFGEVIVKISLREMIQENLLPPYKLWFSYGKEKLGSDLKTKAQLFARAFQEKKEDKYLMNHGILFAEDHIACKILLEELPSCFPPGECPLLIYLDKASNVRTSLQMFEKSKRAILINCQLLGEGVDIPVADSVAILYQKHSYVQLVQMLLRPGRQYPGKKEFYIILTPIESEDLSDVKFTLEALAQIDPYFEEAVLKYKIPKELGEGPSSGDRDGGKGLEGLMDQSTVLWNDIPGLRKCFEEIQQKRVGKMTTRAQFDLFRRICRNQGISNSIEYKRIQLEKGWPESPWLLRDMSPYDFFCDEDKEKITQEEFKYWIGVAKLCTTEEYREWQLQNKNFPTVEDINEGYFSKDITSVTGFLGTRRR